MDAGTHVALTMGVTHGTLMLLALRELWLLRRDDGRGSGRRKPPGEPVPPTPPMDGGSPPAPPPRQIPLPDCLIPRRVVPGRVRELEDA